ncbi:hypothetical protein [Bosea sp. (in: a-proteobacteria)]|uniref:hypothetical protein n=1 Tax=Bosea sp. (in: a-proteobacteria) TaxID=1871050 RepID=UPI001AC86C1A|nr:hypothetical protein [Bosea sp. (in: a-proteobacteria)]MBN9438248.1 hypothetical protein [Bosea sp. (in: a-proteobacteria)]
MGNSFSGSSQRRQNMVTETAQREELAKQQEQAETSQVQAMQAGLARETNRLQRIYNTRSIMSAGRVA